MQILDHRFDELGMRPLRVEVLVAEHERAAMLRRSARGNQERASVAEMQQSSRRRCETAAIAGEVHSVSLAPAKALATDNDSNSGFLPTR